MKHRERHPVDVEGCFGCKVLYFSVSADAIPTRRPRAAEVNATERRWDVDMPAYKRMRRNGVQPRSIDGCAHLERHASDAIELEMGKVIPFRDLKQRITEGNEASKELGLI